MTWPMVLLAVGSVASGGLLAVGGTLQHWLEPVVGSHEAAEAVPVWAATAMILAVVTAGIAVAYRMYAMHAVTEQIPAGSPITVAAREDLYADAVNERVLMKPGARLTRAMVLVDDHGVDGVVVAISAIISRTSVRLRQWQTGFARTYALSILTGTAVVIATLLMVRTW